MQDCLDPKGLAWPTSSRQIAAWGLTWCCTWATITTAESACPEGLAARSSLRLWLGLVAGDFFQPAAPLLRRTLGDGAWQYESTCGPAKAGIA